MGSVAVIVGTAVTMAVDKEEGIMWLKVFGGIWTFPAAYLLHKYYNKTKLVPLDKCDIMTGIYQLMLGNVNTDPECRKYLADGDISSEGGHLKKQYTMKRV
jgi:amino acid permease